MSTIASAADVLHLQEPVPGGEASLNHTHNLLFDGAVGLRCCSFDSGQPPAKTSRVVQFFPEGSLNVRLPCRRLR